MGAFDLKRSGLTPRYGANPTAMGLGSLLWGFRSYCYGAGAPQLWG